MGTSFLEVLHDSLTRKLLGFDAENAEPIPFISGTNSRLKFLVTDPTHQLSLLKIGYTALEAFLQANCTGPPLDFQPAEHIIPETFRDQDLKALRNEMLNFLSVDGSRPYSLTPHIELFWLAQVVLSNPTLAEAGFNGRRGRFRLNIWHQKLLPEESHTLRDIIYSDAEILGQQLFSRLAFGGAAAEEHFVEFLIERAVIRTYYGEDALARTDLARAARTRQFEFVLTGALGKRTKFQEKDTSQLVVLAKSRDFEPEPYSSRKSSRVEGMDGSKPGTPLQISTSRSGSHQRGMSAGDHHIPKSPRDHLPTQPENLLLNDDTLLERINFRITDPPPPPSVSIDTMTQIMPPDSIIPPQLALLDPSNQPLLFPMDSVILLATASSITNTSPDDGLAREETLPYATRVLEGGSSNWQVYTQALLVRSRIEGYRVRTTERGLLQLQALVDQVIAETTQPVSQSNTETLPQNNTGPTSNPTSNPASFLPRPSESESASVAERLQYIYQLSPPLRWDLEAELAQRWTSLGGLKSALEIYERLEMHAEVALCLAATDAEPKAIALLRKLLFQEQGRPASSNGKFEAGKETLRSPLPADAPRLLCILGDITFQPAYYDLSWKTSSNRYSRAQRSLGRYYTKQREFARAAEAYELALSNSRLDRATWFSLGGLQLELERFEPAVESFTRCVQLDDQDAESWSNLAIAILRLPQTDGPVVTTTSNPDEPAPTIHPKRYKQDALLALRRATNLKRDDARIWDNYLTVAASIPPSEGTPWGEVIQAMMRVVELRGQKEGEGCVDVKIFGALTEYITATFEYPGERAEKEDAEEEESKTEAELADEVAVVDDEENWNEDTMQKDPTRLDDDAFFPTTTTLSSNLSPSKPTKLPYIVRSYLSLIHQIVPLLTSSPSLSTLLSTTAQWRQRPHVSLVMAEKSWLSLLTQISPTENFDDISAIEWKEVVEKTIWMVAKYKDLGPQERERTGGQVEEKWAFKARSAVRKVLGRGKRWVEDGDEAAERLKVSVEGI